MPLSELRIPVADGHLAGVRNGGRGTEVLFVHSHGFSSMTWAPVMEHLPDLDCVAFDIRGHGQTHAPLVDAHEAWRDLPLLIESLGMDRPVIVGHETGAFAAVCAAADRPGLARAIITLDANLPFEHRINLQADFDWAQTQELVEQLRERFMFGRTMSTEQEIEDVVAALTEQCINDWLLEGVDRAIESEVRRSIVAQPDGTWLHVPTVESAVIGYQIDIDAPYYPTAELYELLHDHTHIVRYLRSPNVREITPFITLLRELPHLALHDIDGGHLAHYSHASQVAAIIREAAAEEPLPLPTEPRSGRRHAQASRVCGLTHHD